MSIGFSRCSIFSAKGFSLLLSFLVVLTIAGMAPAQSTSPSTYVGSGQNVANTLASLAASPMSRILHKYTALRYSILGPYTLQKVTTTQLTFVSFPEKPDGTTMSLAGKNVAVKTEGGHESSFADLLPGTRVLICQKDNDVIVFLISTATSSSSNK